VSSSIVPANFEEKNTNHMVRVRAVNMVTKIVDYISP